MRKIINGKLYDTEVAELLGSMEQGHEGDFSYIYEALFRTKRGTYFIHGEGGGLTRYRQKYGNLYGYGEDIRVLSEAEARKWVEINLDADSYVNIFGGVEEG